MARLEFAILQYLEGQVRIVLQRDDKQLLDRLQARIKENLGENYSESVQNAVNKAFNGLIKEFKDETIRIV